jgi:hypothetical protein
MTCKSYGPCVLVVGHGWFMLIRHDGYARRFETQSFFERSK